MHKYTQEDVEALFHVASRISDKPITPDNDGVSSFLLTRDNTPSVVYGATKERQLSKYTLDMFDHVNSLYDTVVFNHDNVPETAVFVGIMLKYKDGEYSMSYNFSDGSKASCDSYLVPYSVREGFKLTDNVKVVNGILKGISRCEGKCPCHHPENDGDLTCPCESYRLRNKCCCSLYLSVTE